MYFDDGGISVLGLDIATHTGWVLADIDGGNIKIRKHGLITLDGKKTFRIFKKIESLLNKNMVDYVVSEGIYLGASVNSFSLLNKLQSAIYIAAYLQLGNPDLFLTCEPAKIRKILNISGKKREEIKESSLALVKLTFPKIDLEKYGQNKYDIADAICNVLAFNKEKESFKEWEK